MKKFAIALMTAVLIAGQFFTPVAAAAPSANLASQSCGDTYTVQHGDWLATIASKCGTSVFNILVRNPQIFNPNLIYPGMVLSLTGNARPRNVNFANNGQRFFGRFFIPNTGSFRNAHVHLSTTKAAAGDEVTVYANGFPANANIDFRIGRKDKSFSLVYDGKTKSNGDASQTFTIPSNADTGQDWVVHVLTTELVNGVDLYSPSIHITN